CGKKIGPDPRNFNQRVSLGRNDLLIRTFLSTALNLGQGQIWPGTQKCMQLKQGYLQTNLKLAES
ncbi:hypothetical protein ACC616_25165, partial [Klebsiella pneumoniae]